MCSDQRDGDWMLVACHILSIIVTRRPRFLWVFWIYVVYIGIWIIWKVTILPFIAPQFIILCVVDLWIAIGTIFGVSIQTVRIVCASVHHTEMNYVYNLCLSRTFFPILFFDLIADNTDFPYGSIQTSYNIW